MAYQIGVCCVAERVGGEGYEKEEGGICLFKPNDGPSPVRY